MTDNIIDNAIQEFAPEPAPVVEAPVVSEEAPAEQPQETEVETQEETQETQTEAPVEFPKKAVNALSRRDKKINKLQAQLSELQQQLHSPPAAKPETQVANGKPREEDFESYGDYLRAEIMHDVRNDQSQRDEKAQEKQLTNQQEQYVEQRRASLAEQIEVEAKNIPDFGQVWTENADLLDELPKHIEHAFYEADNAPLAIYTLAKEGKLEELATMSPAKAAMEIGRAQIRATSKPQTSNAPAPLKSAKGTMKTDKSLENKSASELMKWLDE